MAKPKPIAVGTIQCRHDHGPEKKQITAVVKKSLVTNKLFIDCPGCGLIMPTLPDMQEHIKNNATFNEDFSTVYGDGKKFESDGQPEQEKPERVRQDHIPAESKHRSGTDDRAGEGAGGATSSGFEGDDARQPEKVKTRSFEDEMGF